MLTLSHITTISVGPFLLRCPGPRQDTGQRLEMCPAYNGGAMLAFPTHASGGFVTGLRTEGRKRAKSVSVTFLLPKKRLLVCLQPLRCRITVALRA